MGKFKVGDRVRVVKTEKGAEKAVVGDVGTIMEIRNIGPLPYAVKFDVERSQYHPASSGVLSDKHHYFCGESMLNLVSETIVIYRKGNETIAIDKQAGKKAVAKCNPNDEFDFATGAKIAFGRLMGEPEISVKEPEIKEIKYVVFENYKPPVHKEKTNTIPDDIKKCKERIDLAADLIIDMYMNMLRRE